MQILETILLKNHLKMCAKRKKGHNLQLSHIGLRFVLVSCYVQYKICLLHVHCDNARITDLTFATLFDNKNINI